MGLLKEVRRTSVARREISVGKNRILKKWLEDDWGRYIIYTEFNFFLWMPRTVALWDKVIF